MKLGKKGILGTLLARRQELMRGAASPQAIREADDEMDDDEVTQKTNVKEERLPFLLPKEIDALLAELEPLFFSAVLPKFKGKRILYVAAPTLPYLPLIRGVDIPSVVAMGPEMSASVESAPFPVHLLLNQVTDPCFKKDSFDVLILPEATCRGVHFLTRFAYWAGILKDGGEIYLALPHPQLRFLLSTRELRHKSSRTATFERVFERSREVGLDIAVLRELSALQLPQAALKANPKWQRLKQLYEELPVILGLCLKKKGGDK